MVASVVALNLCVCLWAQAVGWAEARDQTMNEVPDAFKVFSEHPYGVAVFDADEDGELDCLTTKRTEFNPEGPSVTYVWMLKGLKGFQRKEIALHMKSGAAPDKVSFTYDDGDQELDMTLLYTDYKACAIVDLPFKGRKECLMWVPYAIKDAVPVHCVEHYDESCEVKIPSYDRDTCSQVPDEL